MGPAITALMQVINVPIMLRNWGPELYGEWLLLSAAPAYLLLSDFGFGNVAGTDMTLRANAGDSEGALETFQSVQALVMLTSAAIAVVVLALLLLLPLHQLFQLTALSTHEVRNTLLLLSLNCLIVLQWSVLIAGYRCTGQYAQGMLYVNGIRIVEGASVFIVLFTNARPTGLAALMLLISVAGTLLLLLRLRRHTPWLRFGFRHARRERIKALASPAFAFMAFPVGNALSTQGMTMIVGIGLGPLAVAVFNPMRTLSRFVLQLSIAVLNAVWPELSAAFGRRDLELARRLHRSACQIAIVLSLLGAVALAIAGPKIFALWTHHQLVMDVRAFRILLISAVVYSTWSASSSVPLALNDHQKLAVYFLTCSVISIALGVALIRPLGLSGAAYASLACDLAMSVYVVRASNHLLEEHWRDFAVGLLDRKVTATLWRKLTRRVRASDPS